MNQIDVIGQLADLKDTDYKNTLAISVLIELFIDKGLFTRDDFTHKTWEVEKSTLTEITSKRRFERIHAVQIDAHTSQL